MPYPYSWAPDRIVPTNASQVSVVDRDKKPAVLTVPVSVAAGVITFTLANVGLYTINVRGGSQLETGTFNVDPTGVDISEPEWITYQFIDNQDGSNVPYVPFPNYITQSQLEDPNSAASASLNAAYVPSSKVGVTVPNLSRAVTQLARAPRIARILNAFMRPPAGLAVGLSGTTYSMYYGWGGGLWWKADLVADSSEPGGFTLHQMRNQTAVSPMLSRPYDDAAVTTSGTWTAGTNAGAYNGKYVYATAAAYKETILPLGATSAALRVPLATNGGRWFLVTIDGDATKADLLMSAQDAVTNNLLDSTQLIANGGTLNPTDRVFDSYASSVGTTNWGGIIPLTMGLDPTVAHTVRVTVTAAVRKGITAPNDRSYFSGFSYGSASIGLTDPSTTIVSVGIMNSSVSAWEHAVKTLPVGGTTATFLGNVHGYEQEISLSFSVAGVPITLTDGQILTTGRDVTITRVGKFFHPDTGAVKIADTSVVYTLSRAGVEIWDTLTWAVQADVSASYAMLVTEGAASNVVGATKFTRASLLNYAGGVLTMTGATETDTYLGSSKSPAAWVWGGKFAGLIHVPDVEGYTNDWQWAQTSAARVEDRNLAAGGRMSKVYIPRNADLVETVQPGDVHTYRSQILFSYFPTGAEASLAAL